MAITHAKTSAISDSGDSTLVQPSDWNDDHTVDLSDYAGAITGGTATLTAVNLGDEDLSEYDEGTWTPAITFSTAGDLSVAYSKQDATYTRTGRLVTCTARITCSSFTHTTASGQFRITGLPFAAAATYNPVGSLIFQGWDYGTAEQVNCQVLAGNTQMYVTMTRNSSLAEVVMTSSTVPTGGTPDLHLTVTYEV